MRRFEDWPERLDAAIEAARVRPWRWGDHDCVLFAADLVLAMTGIDPMRGLRGRYNTAIGAARIIRRTGGGDLEGAVASILGGLGYPTIAVTEAQRGDAILFTGVVLPDATLVPAVGICVGLE